MKELWSRLKGMVATHWERIKIRNAEQRRHETEVNQAVERVVEQINPRLRAIGSYRKKLFPVVERAQGYVRELTLRVPGPIPVSRRTWNNEPLVNALFGSVERIRRVLSGPEVRGYLKKFPVGGDCYAIIAAFPNVSGRFGVEMVGDMLRKDVRQTAVSFSDHEVAVVGESEAQVREALEGEALDLLASLAAQDILEQESRIAEIKERLRIVRLKLRVADSRSRGAKLLLDDNPERLGERETLAARVAELEKDLVREKRGLTGLDDYLDRLVELLAHPERHLGLERESVRIDRMNILREEDDERAGREIEFTRVRRGDRLVRVLAIIRFPRSEVMADAERLREVERHLG